mmetsp:Transcript_6738/g.19734  ORF Transcript_6738/g.19734 Transcript_6738/m.19734 type:complete len:341 (-) Transcript_6738:197-1219(-)
MMKFGDVIISGHDVLHVPFQHLIELDVRIAPWIDVAVPQLTGGMVHVSVLRLVGANGVHQIQDGPVLSEMPVRTGDVGRGLVLPGGQLGSFRSILDRLDDLGVRDARLLLDVPHEAVAEFGTGEVGKQEGTAKSKLRKHDRGTEGNRRILHLDEGQQMHALVVGLLQEQVQQSAVTFHVAQALEMTADGGHHSRNGRDGFQEDHTIQDLVGGDILVVPTGGIVEEEAHHLHRIQRHLVHEGGRCHVRDLDVQILWRVGRMGLAVDEFRAAVAIQDGMVVDSGRRVVEGDDEILEADASACLASIEKLREFDDLLVGECRVVLLQQIAQILVVESVGIERM